MYVCLHLAEPLVMTSSDVTIQVSLTRGVTAIISFIVSSKFFVALDTNIYALISVLRWAKNDA